MVDITDRAALTARIAEVKPFRDLDSDARDEWRSLSLTLRKLDDPDWDHPDLHTPAYLEWIGRQQQ